MIRFTYGSRSARLPDSIYGRHAEGESLSELADDYSIPTHAAEWAIELAALRIMAESRPRTKRHQEAREVLRKMGRIEG